MYKVVIHFGNLEYIQEPTRIGEHFHWVRNYMDIVRHSMDLRPFRILDFTDFQIDIKDFEEVYDIIEFGENMRESFSLRKDENHYPCFDFHFDKYYLNINYFAEEGDLEETMAIFSSYAKNHLKDLSEHFALGNISLTYEVASSKYAIKRPPMDYPLQVFTPVDLLDKRYLQNRKSLEKHLPFFEKSLPPGVQREWITDDIVLITWIQNAKNEDELIQQYYTKEDWMRENLELKLGSNWNIHGDKIMRRPNAITLDKEEDDVFFDRYYDVLDMGLKTIPDEVLQDFNHPTWTTLANYSKTMLLSCGDPFSAIGIILPTRELAIKMQKKAKELHFDKAYYEGDPDVLYDIWPEGIAVQNRNSHKLNSSCNGFSAYLDGSIFSLFRISQMSFCKNSNIGITAIN